MRNYLFILCLLVVFSCKKEHSLITEAYKSEIDTYRTERHDSRKRGYLQLTGLHKLGAVNTFGKNTENDFAFNIVDIPEHIGTITVKDSLIEFIAAKNVRVTTEKDSVLTKVSLGLDKYGSSIKMYYQHANWQVITRSGSLYLRVWDEKNPAIETFKGFEFFDLNPDLIIQGDFTYYETTKTEAVKSQLGVNANTNFIGKVTFQYNGEIHNLDVGTNGFTMVGDATTGDSSYGGGRYIYLDLPKENGTVEIDFNKLYNPPCSFSTYTTCLYPPRQNHLPININAGETITTIN